MAKRKIKGRIAESTATHHLRVKQKRKPPSPKQKLNAISSLAKKSIDAPMGAPNFSISGAQAFAEAARLRTRLTQISHAGKSRRQRREFIIAFYQGGPKVRETIGMINNWLEEIKRPDLKLSYDEFLDIILS